MEGGEYGATAIARQLVQWGKCPVGMLCAGTIQKLARVLGRDPPMNQEFMATYNVTELIAQLPTAVCVCEAPNGIIRFYNRRAGGSRAGPGSERAFLRGGPSSCTLMELRSRTLRPPWPKCSVTANPLQGAITDPSNGTGGNTSDCQIPLGPPPSDCYCHCRRRCLYRPHNIGA